jgi:hypothetical protein
MSCAKDCLAERNQCRQVSRLQEQADEAFYQADLRNQRNCAKGRTKKNAREYCDEPSAPPLNFGQTNTCEGDFDQCYQICGGTIQRTLEKN